MELSSTAARETESRITPPSSAHDHCGPLILEDIPLPLTPPSTCETHTHYGCAPRIPPPATPPFSTPWIVRDGGPRVPLAPTLPMIELKKHTIVREDRYSHKYWVKIVGMEAVQAQGIVTHEDADQATRTIWDIYVHRIVYLESIEPLQGYEMMHATWTALITWHKNDSVCGLAIGTTATDLCVITPKNLYEPPFKLTDIPRSGTTGSRLTLMPDTEVLVVRTLHENVDVVTLRSGSMDIPSQKRMIHKKMTPETLPEHMIYEVDRYLALNGCQYAPKLLGVTGDPGTGECRGLLIELIDGLPLYPVPFMFNTMRLEVTMKLLKAVVDMEERNVYLQDLKPNNIILTVDDSVYLVDFGPGVTDGFYPEEEEEATEAGKVGVKTAMYGLFMTWRVIWNEGMPGKDGLPAAPTRLRDRCPPRLLSLLDNPDTSGYSSFRQLQEELQQE